MKNFVPAFLLLLPLLISGCGHTPVRSNTMPLALPQEMVSAKIASGRAAEFRKITAALPVRVITVFPSAFIGRAPQQVEAFLAEVVYPLLDANKDDVKNGDSVNV